MIDQKLTIAVHYLRARRRFAHLRGAALERYQDRRARRIVAYARNHSPFYREHFAGKETADWRTLPTVDKQAMMARFRAFNTRGVSLEAAMAVALQAERVRDFSPTVGGLTVGLSSGTSGHRGLFLVSAWEQAVWAGIMLARTLPGLRRRGYRVALFHRSNSNLYARLGNRGLQFRYFDLMLPRAEAADALNAYQPDLLAGPPSLLVLLADARRAGSLRIAPEQVFTTAEVLEPQDSERIEESFGLPVDQIYQCTEGLLAVSCRRHALHVQEDMVALQFEPLPGDDGRQVTPIVTDLWRTTQPILRYRLNDVLTLDPRSCPCGSGFRVIRSIEGRRDDVCYFLSHEGGPRPFFPDTIRRMVLLSSPHIEDYQAVQEREGYLRIHLSVAPGHSFDAVARAVRASVASTVAQYDCRPATVTIERGLMPVTPAAKRRRVQRLTQEDELPAKMG